MSMTTGKELRKAYLEYFRTIPTHPHPVVGSAPLVPPDDPTLLFTSAGMVQFKALYSGTVELPYPYAASCQKCLRAGGKGSDLENVGKTLRHHTFFEMLGNFSFGDYFKREAIRFAWEFCTSPKWMNLPKERMFPTIFGPTPDKIDTEAVQYYREETDCPNPLIPLDESENFWGPAGDTGACGPCSEIKFFMGSDEELRQIQEELRTGGDAALKKLGQRVIDEGDLFLEIWNMVFPQFDQQRDGSRVLLKNKGIDTGAGLERMTVALNFARTGKLSTPYETDLMWPITKAVAAQCLRGTHLRYFTLQAHQDELPKDIDQMLVSLDPDVRASLGDAVARLLHPAFLIDPTWQNAIITFDKDLPLRLRGTERTNPIFAFKSMQLDRAQTRLRINAIADHVRTLVFCLAEGLTPGNVGRRYVIRRIQRRALRFASMLGMKQPFMADLYDAVVEAMGDAYPEITKNPDFIRKSLRIEEETFLRTLDRGTKILNELMAQARDSGTNRIPGEEAFRLWDTYGFPLDLTREIAEDEGITLDQAGYDAAMKRQKEDAKKSWKGAKLDFNEESLDPIYEEHGATDFVGYDSTAPVETEILALVPTSGDRSILVLKTTPFYAESGGQVGDTGTIEGQEFRFVVSDTQKSPQGLFLHRGKIAHGQPRAGASVVARIDAARREATIRNHSSVHLLQSALKRLVGEHITQAGSFVGPDYARFDFTHTEPITREQQTAVQREVNRMILRNDPVVTEVLPIEEAKAKGAIAPFGEKYGAVVRVVTMGPESVEFCGGTHAPSTGYISHFRVVSEASIAAGVRRIEAVTGAGALEKELEEQYSVVAPLQSMLAVKGPETLTRIEQLQSRLKDLEKEIAKLKRDAALKDVDRYAQSATDLNGTAKLVVARMDGLDGNELRAVATALRDKVGDTSVIAILSATEGKVAIVAAVGKSAQAAFPAGTVVNKLAAPLGGKGGGKPDMAQAGAKDIEKLDQVISTAAQLLKE